MLDLEMLSSKEQVTAIFIGYYDRAPAPNGLNYWSDELDNGASLADVARAFAVVTESQTLYPALGTSGSTTLQGNIDFVTAVFNNLFGRDPNFDADGNNYWVTELQNGADIGQTILAIMGGAQGSDREILTNKIEVGLAYANASEAAGELGRLDAGDTILDGVTAADASVATAQAAIEAQFPEDVTSGPLNPISLNGSVPIDGTDGNDVFMAESGDLTSSIQLNGLGGTDALTVFNENIGAVFDGTGSANVVAMAPRTESIEQIYFTNQADDESNFADNNVAAFGTDVEIDAGRMQGVTRWENFDSRADVVIEDARDNTVDFGTFTAGLTVAMVSTDPGNVDYAVYFDDPINTSTSSGTLTVQILDLDSSAAGGGPLDNNPYDLVSFNIDGVLFELEVADLDAANASYAAYVAALQASANAQGIPVTITLGEQFTLLQANGSSEVGTEINISVENAVISEGGFDANDALPANNNTVTRQSPLNQDNQQKITLNVEFDDVGKGSTGGDALFGAMSTGREDGDQTSNSTGIERFEILVDRGSNLQTINSTNNALEEVQIRNGENSGLNNTDGADDNAAGGLTVRGDARPESNNASSDNGFPGATPQHNNFGFSDVRTIEAGDMIGDLDLTLELTDAIVGKYLQTQDGAPNGEADDVVFTYDLGNGNDEFLLNMSSDALNVAGTGSREDFNLAIDGGAGADVITTNISGNQDVEGLVSSAPGAVKRIDSLKEDYYELTSDNVQNWYANAVSNVAAEMSVDGGAGDDVIWTHGWGDFTIDDGAGNDTVYTDNSGATELTAQAVSVDLFRNPDEHEQIDYVIGSAWAFNAEGTLATGLSGSTNETITLATLPANSPLLNANTGFVTVVVSYDGAQGANSNDYNVSVQIPFSEISIDAARNVTITEQALNQAIKSAVNAENGVLSKVLEASDGPGNSLIVSTKVDGVHEADDFTVAFASNMQLNGTNVAVTGSLGAEYTPAAGTTFTTGVDSVAESDNTLNVGSGNDVFVLSTNDGNSSTFTPATNLDAPSDLNGASNETLNFGMNFGRDTVFNFDAGANDGTVDNADDVMDFTGITGVAVNSLLGTPGAQASTLETVNGTATGSVDIVAAAAIVDVNSSGTIDAADFAALYQGDATASSHIIIVWDTTGDNGGEVWNITDGAQATGDVGATEMGTINLIGTDWAAIGNDNIA